MDLKYLFFSCFTLYLFSAVDSSNCNEAVCGSVVSKCMLTQSCKCDLTHCPCCKDCFNCLSYLYQQCCSCVDMCPGVYALTTALSKESFTEDFREGGVPALFTSLTSDPDLYTIDYTAVTVPVSVSDASLQSVEDDVSKQNSLYNCTVVYMAQCMSLDKCRNSCNSMGATGFRWFRDGCCECVGENCGNHGIDENRCSNCNDRNEEDIPEDNLNYGEELDVLESESV